MWHEFSSHAPYLDALMRDISSTLRDAVTRSGRACLAVSGGRSPIALFDALSRADLPWSSIDITLVDERFVPPDHADSNERLVREHLLQNRACAATFTGLVSQPDSLQRSLDQANRQHTALTLVLLGMGDDGHTASLFPDAPQLAQGLDRQQTKRYLHMTPPGAPHERISMTLAALLGAQRIMIAIAGPAKRQVLARAAESPNPALPISYVVTQKEVPFDVYWHD